MVDFTAFMEDFVVGCLKKAFSINGSTIEEVIAKLLDNFDKVPEDSEFKVIVDPSGGVEVMLIILHGS